MVNILTVSLVACFGGVWLLGLSGDWLLDPPLTLDALDEKAKACLLGRRAFSGSRSICARSLVRVRHGFRRRGWPGTLKPRAEAC
jgi:hypothetical protein